jgi:hypothetical protein
MSDSRAKKVANFEQEIGQYVSARSKAHKFAPANHE